MLFFLTILLVVVFINPCYGLAPLTKAKSNTKVLFANRLSSLRSRRFLSMDIDGVVWNDDRNGFSLSTNSRQNKIAVLIDGDNAESTLISEFIAEAGRFGRVTVKRIYADWTLPTMKSWKDQLNNFAVRPIQKFAYTKSKSSTDTALIIDAMDLLHSKLVDGFCIVSSDSDYTGLCHRIREEGLFIMGIGKSHTPKAFVRACERFTYSEILAPLSLAPSPKDEIKAYLKKKVNVEKSSKTRKGNDSTPISSANTKAVVRKSRKTKSVTAASSTIESVFAAKEEEEEEGTTSAKINAPTSSSASSISLDSLENVTIKKIDLREVHRAFRIAVNIDTGQASLSRLSEALRASDPTFDPRNYGFSSFRRFCDSLKPDYETVFLQDGCTILIQEAIGNKLSS